jgi:sterol desaturase/sphingolipid hydroxylase (fatty acid hydroxylase superfamily)
VRATGGRRGRPGGALDRFAYPAWLAQPAYLAAEVLLALLAGVHYSLADDTISALGTGCPSPAATGCSAAPWVMNLVFVLFGVLQAFVAQPLAVLLHARWLATGRPRVAGTALGVAAVVGAVAFAALLGADSWSGAAERLAIWPAKLWLPLAALRPGSTPAAGAAAPARRGGR